VSVLSPQGRRPLAQCSVTGSVVRVFDKTAKGFVYVLEGPETALRLPAGPLLQPCLVFQLQVASGKPCTVELRIADTAGRTHRLSLSTHLRRPAASAGGHLRLPLQLPPNMVCVGELLQSICTHVCVSVCVECAMLTARYDGWGGDQQVGACVSTRAGTADASLSHCRLSGHRLGGYWYASEPASDTRRHLCSHLKRIIFPS
jgi:hypothetical protein